MKSYIVFFVLLAIGGMVYYYSFYKKESPVKKSPEPVPIAQADAKLIKEVLREGTGAAAMAGDTVIVHYTGTLIDGTKFDSSLDRGTPFSFVLGSGKAIQGWEQGILGMKIGEKAKLTVPPDLAYGDEAVGGLIPANSTLIFEVELLEIK